MLITVEYKTGGVALVDAYRVDALIRSNKIKKFLRLDGWVTVGLDPVRRICSTNGYSGANRRRSFEDAGAVSFDTINVG